MGLSLTPFAHVSTSPLCDPGRWVFPSPVLTLASKFLKRLPRTSEAQALTRLHPASCSFTLDSVPKQSAGPPCPGHVGQPRPRAPLPLLGVTSEGGMSCIPSEGVTPPSSLIWTHASVPNPPPASGITPWSAGLCRLLSVPAGRGTFPTLSLRILPDVPRPLPRWLRECICPFLPP